MEQTEIKGVEICPTSSLEESMLFHVRYNSTT